MGGYYLTRSEAVSAWDTATERGGSALVNSAQALSFQTVFNWQ